MVVTATTAAVTAEKRLGVTLVVVVKMVVDDGVYVSNGGLLMVRVVLSARK
jgi:hypothetical protein